MEGPKLSALFLHISQGRTRDVRQHTKDTNTKDSLYKCRNVVMQKSRHVPSDQHACHMTEEHL